jgi:tRNA (guanine37-N1)-methyltransferase
VDVEVFTLFPGVFPAYLETSILQRAQQKHILTVRVHNIRDFAADRHHTTDDLPYGGGGGMVMKPEPVFEAVERVLGSPAETAPCPIILMTPQGRVFNQSIARELSEHQRIAVICGRYEGVDERIRTHLATDEISIGDFVITGGELPALILIDAVTRLLPDALGDPGGAQSDSHVGGLLEHPHFTRPPEFRGQKVPDVLLSGDHARIERWRHEQALLRTLERRRDLLMKASLSDEDRRFLTEQDQGTGP